MLVPIYSAVGGEVTTDGDYLVFEGNRFSRKGYMYKTLALSAIIYDGVKPTLAELEKFDDKPEKLDIQCILATFSRFVTAERFTFSKEEITFFG